MRGLLLFQAGYYLLTGIWPLISIRTFEAVTGPKTDDWLVQTVGVLAAVIGGTLLVGSRREAATRETLTLAVLAALGFAAVDIVFVVLGTISRIYLVDAVVQALILVALTICAVARRRNATPGAPA
jgi:hypothetical protein